MALQTYTLNAGMWGNNGPVGTISYDFKDLYKEVTGDPTASFSVGNDKPAFLYANAHGSLGLNYKLGFGLVGSLKFASGDVHSTYSFDPNVKDASNVGVYTALDTSSWVKGPAELSSNGFDLSKSSIDLNLVGTAYARLHGDFHVNAGVYIDPVKVGGFTILPGVDADIGNPGTSFNTTLLDYNFNKNILHLSGDSGPFNYDYGYGNLSVNVPGNVKTSTKDISGLGLGTLNSSGVSDPFITADFNVVAAIGALFGIPPEVFQGSKFVDIGIGSLGYDYKTLAADLEGKVSLRQDFSFSPDVNVSMKTSLGQTVTGKVGDKFFFDTPQGEGDFNVDATYALNGKLTNNTGLYLTSDFNFRALEATLHEHFNGVSIAGYSIGARDWSQHIGPLVNQTLPIGGGALIPLYSNTSTYDLGSKTETYKVHYEKFVDGTGGDILRLTTHQTSVIANNNGDTIYGNGMQNTLFGGNGNDLFVMGVGSGDASSPNYAFGGAGNDVFRPDLGVNIIAGDTGYYWSGIGYDTIDYSATSDKLVFDLGKGTVTKFGAVDKFSGIENFVAGSGDDTFTLGKSGDTGPAPAIFGPITFNGDNLVVMPAPDAAKFPLGYDGTFVSVNGGAGQDTADFLSKLSDVHVRHAIDGTPIYDTQNGSYEFSSVENFKGSDGSISQNTSQPLIDKLYYNISNKDVLNAKVDADEHYASFGWHEGRDPNAYFSTDGYRAANPDVAKAGINPLNHYDQFGWKEGRDPSVFFDNEQYLVHNPDVKAAGIDPLAHYLQNGQSEGRESYAAVGRASDFTHGSFDAEYYLLANPDVAKAAIATGGDAFNFAFQHYSDNGWHEGRMADAFFDSAYYLAHNLDVAAAHINPLTHYDQFGWKEGRDPSAAFDTSAYLAANSDVAAAKIDPLLHYLQFGLYEGRSFFADGSFGSGTHG